MPDPPHGLCRGGPSYGSHRRAVEPATPARTPAQLRRAALAVEQRCTAVYASMVDRDRDPYDTLTPEFEYWPVADPTAVEGEPMAGGIAQGSFWLSGRILEQP